MSKRNLKLASKLDSSPVSILDLNASPKKGRWTPAEDDLLHRAISEHGAKNWRKIASFLQGRSSIQCLHRWTKILQPGLVKGPWSKEEDFFLHQWVQEHGTEKWADAAEVIKGRSAKQIRERWNNILDPGLKKDTWGEKEEKLLFELYLKFGSKWAKIKKFFEGRTENQIKNRFFSTLRKSATETKRKEGRGGCVRSEKMDDLLKYLPIVIDKLKADINSLPENLELDNAIVIFTNNMRKDQEEPDIQKDKEEQQAKKSRREIFKDSPALLISCSSKDTKKKEKAQTNVFNLFPFDLKSNNYKLNVISIKNDEEEKIKEKQPKSSNAKMSKKRSRETIKEEIKDGIEYKTFNVFNKDGELNIRFGIKSNSKSSAGQKSDEIKKYDLILEAMKSMSSKIEKAMKEKS